MKPTRTISFVLLLAGLIGVPQCVSLAQSDEEALQLIRSAIKTERHTAVAEALQLGGAESKNFWPLYDEYRAEMDKVADGLVKLVQDYSKLYPDVPDERAKQMLKQMTELEKKRLATRVAYLKKFGKVLPAHKNLRLAQVENRLDLAVQLKLASGIPLVPTEGRFTGQLTTAAVAVEGAPGGAVVQTYTITARVAAIDKTSRKVTLVSPDGFKKVVKVGPEAVNFDQVHVGDRLKVTATEELVVQMSRPGEAVDTGVAGVVALAPKGAKPGGLAAETLQITATVQAIDLEARKVRLRFPDGDSRVLPVRSDVDLAARKVGDQVVIRSTETLAIAVEKP